MRFSIFSTALVAAVVGFASTLALLIGAAKAVGATEAQTASWVSAICLAKLVETGFLSWRYRAPIITAWSTAGLALIAASDGLTLEQAAGAFVVAGLMLTATGFASPLTRLVERIPAPVSAGMLGGILLPFAIGAAKAVEADPAFMAPLAALFFAARLKNPPLAVVATLVCGVAAAWLLAAPGAFDAFSPRLSQLEFIIPQFTLQATIGLAVPLYLVTMASQNLPGLAVLRASGYNPPSGPLIATTGIASTVSAFFGASTSNLAAITAALCTGPDVHPDPGKRWLAGMFYAGFYGLFAIFGASLVALFAVLPPALIALVAGLALLAPLANAAGMAMQDPGGRFSAMATFAITASGVAFAGIGAAFWGLLAGIALHMAQEFVLKRSKAA